MKDSHQYKILPEYKLNLQVYRGKVTLDIMFDSMKDLVNDNDYKVSNNGIVDFREAELEFKNKELEILLSFLQELKITSILRKIALLTNTPNQVAFIMLFSHLAESSTNIDYKVFSTFEGAMKFLRIADDKHLIVDSVLESLSKSGG